MNDQSAYLVALAHTAEGRQRKMRGPGEVVLERAAARLGLGRDVNAIIAVAMQESPRGAFMADGLKPSSYGKRVEFDGAAREIVDGPFEESRELVAGFWLWEVKDMDEAVAWGKRCPNPMPGKSEIEIRPI